MVKKIVLALVVGVVALAGGAWWYVNARVRGEIDTRLQSLVASGAYEAITYDSLRLRPDGRIDIGNLRVVRPDSEVLVRTIEISNYDFAHDPPWYLEVDAAGFSFPGGLPDLSPSSGSGALNRFLQGLLEDDTLPLQFNYRYSYDPAAAHHLDTHMALALERAFLLDFTLVTRNLELGAVNDLSTLDPDPLVAQAQLMAQLEDLAIPAMALNLTDLGILDALLTENARDFGMAKEDFRTLLISQARNFYLFAPQQLQGMAMSTGIQVGAFLEGNKSLSVNLEPEFGGNFRQLQEEITGAIFTGNLARAVEVLNLEIMAR